MSRDQATIVGGRSGFRMLGLAALIVAFGAGAGGSTARAAAVAFSFGGTITDASAVNDFGLSIGDVVTLSGSYDDSFYDGVGAGAVPFGLGRGNSLTLALRAITLFESNDIDYLNGFFPTVSFLDGGLAGTTIIMNIGVNGSAVNFSSLGMNFDGEDPSGGFIVGRWGVVPEPSSVALMGLGLIGVAAMGRRHARG